MTSADQTESPAPGALVVVSQPGVQGTGVPWYYATS